MKDSLIYLLLIFSIVTISCNKKEVDDIPADENPLKVTTLLPLTDSIPFQSLGSGKILFERNYGPDESLFYIIDIDKGKSSGFTLKSFITQPSISPDGTKIACSLINSTDFNAIRNIYIMNIDGSGCFPAFLSGQPANYPTWNKDGSKIAFYSGGADSRLLMQSPTENSSDTVELVKFYDNDDPEWSINPSGGFTVSPEGNLVGISNSEELSGIIGIEPYKGKEGVSVLASPLDVYPVGSLDCHLESPVFSPDGLKIAFLAVLTNPIETSMITLLIYIMDPDGTNLTAIGGIGGYQPEARRRYVSLCWSPDRTKILFALPDGEETCHLYVVNLDGSGYFQVTNQMNAFDSNVSWSR